MLSIAKGVSAEHHLQLNEAQLTKIMELNEQMNRRMGVVIVGPPGELLWGVHCIWMILGAGKSTLWQVLKQTLEKQGTSVDLHTLNPKSMPKTRVGGSI